MSHSSKPIPVKSEDVQIKVRVDYAEAAKMFRKNEQLFFRDMSNKQAYYAKRRLEFLCKCKLEAHPAIHPELKAEGYLFHKID